MILDLLLKNKYIVTFLPLCNIKYTAIHNYMNRRCISQLILFRNLFCADSFRFLLELFQNLNFSPRCIAEILIEITLKILPLLEPRNIIFLTNKSLFDLESNTFYDVMPLCMIGFIYSIHDQYPTMMVDNIQHRYKAFSDKHNTTRDNDGAATR